MRITVLGAIAADDDKAVALGGPTQRRLLARLAMDPGDIVSIDHLIDCTWAPEDVPANPERNLRSYVHRLRSAFGPELEERIETAPPGYRLRLGPDELDRIDFEHLASESRRLAEAGDIEAALDRIDGAEQLWRGVPFGEFADEAWARPEVERLTEVRTALRERRIELMLVSGRESAAPPLAEALADELPYRERPRALLMRSLALAGRQAEALRAFQAYRSVMLEEMGLDPSDDLVALDRTIARGELTLEPTPDTRRVGPYQLHEPIGEGAFAVVHRGTQQTLDRPVAIKVIRAELADQPEFIRRFEAEARLVARIEHPNVTPLYDYWREPGRAYLVMRWMTGGTLESRLRSRTATVAEAVSLVDQIAPALDAAHAAGVIHRDVKPANILFDDGDRAFLSDFGIAVDAGDVADADPSLSGGSHPWASPEQSRRQPVGPESDVYALAMVAFHALTRALPTLPSETQLPAAVDAVLRTALAPQPSERYGSAGAFAAAFRDAAQGKTPEGEAPAVVTANPYVGLRAFEEGDADVFFGRDRLIEQVVTPLRAGTSSIVGVVGPSGVGKSSVVRAGLIPAVRAGAIPGSEDWFVTTMTPGIEPFEALGAALRGVAIADDPQLPESLRAHPRAITRTVRRILPPGATLLLVLDQFEELFSPDVDSDERAGFIDALVVAARDPDSPLKVVVTIRADFYDRPLQHPELADALRTATVTVAPPSAGELAELIVGPARLAGAALESGLVAQIVADVATQPGALPLVEFALTELFERRDGRVLSLESYRALGGLSGVVAQRADACFSALDETRQAAARALFGRLVEVGNTISTRRRLVLDQLDQTLVVTAVIDSFAANRLLTIDRDPRTRQPSIEVAHEALIGEWDRLRGWLEEDREELLLRQHLEATAGAWQRRGRDSGDLYRGVRLDAAADLHEQDPTLSGVEREFLDASIATRAKAQATERSRVRRLRRLVTATSIVAVVALVAGLLAIREQRRANDNAASAEASAAAAEASATIAEANAAAAETARISATAVTLAPTNQRAALLLAVLAHQRGPSPSTLSALHTALSEPTLVSRHVGHGTSYSDVAWLEDNRMVGVRSQGLDLYDLGSGELIDTIEVSIGPGPWPGRSNVARADGAGSTLVVAGTNAVTVYDVDDAMTERWTMEVGAAVSSVDVRPDGAAAIVTTVQGQVMAWSLRGESLFEPIEVPAPFSVAQQHYENSELPLANAAGMATVPAWINTVAHEEHIHVQAGAITRTIDYSGAEIEAPIYGYYFSGSEAVPAAVRYFLHLDADATIVTSGKSIAVVTADDREAGLLELARLETLQLSEASGRVLWAGLEEAAATETRSVRILASDGSFARFEAETGRRIEVTDLQGEKTSTAVAPDGSAVAVSSTNGIAVLQLDGSSPITTAIPRDPAQVQVSLSYNGEYVVLAGGGGAAAPIGVWRAGTDDTFRELDNFPIESALWAGAGVSHGPHRVGNRMLTVGEVVDGTPYTPDGVWVSGFSFDGPDAPVPLTRLNNFPIWGTGDVDPLGRWVVSDDANSILVWDSDAVEIIERLPYPPGAAAGTILTGSRLNPSGTRLLVGAPSGAAVLYDTASWTIDDESPVGDLDITTGYWSYDGSLVATAASDGQIAVRDGTTFEPIREMIGAPGSVNKFAGGALVFSDDNTLLLSDFDNVGRLWDVVTGQQIGRDMTTLAGTRSGIDMGESLQLVTASDTHALVWNLDPTTWVDIACSTAGSNLTRAEWDQWGPGDEDYRAICTEFPLPDNT